jgi:hypothetical protein
MVDASAHELQRCEASWLNTQVVKSPKGTLAGFPDVDGLEAPRSNGNRHIQVYCAFEAYCCCFLPVGSWPKVIVAA